MCYNGAPVLSRNGIYFSKAVRSYGNILLWGIVVVSAVHSPFIMILWHLGEDTLWEISTQRLVPDIHTYCVHAHTYLLVHMYAYIWAQRHGGTVYTHLVCASTHVQCHKLIQMTTNTCTDIHTQARSHTQLFSYLHISTTIAQHPLVHPPKGGDTPYIRYIHICCMTHTSLQLQSKFVRMCTHIEQK